MDEMTITPSAETYLQDLLSSQDDDTCGIKIFVSEPGTPRAETCIAYAKDDENLSDDHCHMKTGHNLIENLYEGM